eukprot:TRINITY_DN15765_c0_g1_i2.p1 TRINITY_DN15765_c0_g1~~TRINITY_DN15765_c0_g1_i2.p1  ORF type:complete len:219 (+),score=27.71 TRINITY_DN15765_c0_g1_i2:607-1263(+)
MCNPHGDCWFKPLPPIHFRHLIDFFLAYENLLLGPDVMNKLLVTPGTELNLSKSESVACVLVNTRADIILKRYAFLEPVQLAPTHKIFTTGTVSKIASMAGLPIVGSFDQGYNHKNCLKRNYQPAVFLFMEMDPDSSTWGWIPQDWSLGGIAPVLLARSDKKPLYMDQVEAMILYCSKYLQKQVENVMESEGGTANRKRLLRTITPTAFLEYISRTLR